MKKLFLVLTLFLGFSVVAIAQPRAIGGRIGSNFEASYQHSLGNNFLEFDAGLINYSRGVQFSGIYNFIIASPNWTSEGEWNFYGGPGAGFGYRWHDTHRIDRINSNHHGHHYVNDWKSAAILGVIGQFGLEYTFDFNLQLSVDCRPFIGIAVGEDVGSWSHSKMDYRNSRFYTQGLFDFAVSARYRF